VSRRSLIIVAALVTVSGIGAVWFATSQGSDSAELPTNYSRMIEGLCVSANLAGSGDLDGSERTFIDLAHQPLHELASESQDVDRAGTAELLRAKQQIEDAYASQAPEVSELLDDLLLVTLPLLPDNELDQTADPCSTGN
jgi:hypothetical protein